MEKTFDHLLGLNARSALAVLASYGITDVRVTLTGAPPMRANLAQASVPAKPERESLLAGIAGQFSAGEQDQDDDEDEGSGFDPLMDAVLDEGMLTEARVVAVRDDGRQLVVARFHVGQPKPRDAQTQ